MTETALITLVVQTGFAGLFVWLLYDTRREAVKREDKLTATMESLSKALTSLAASFEQMERKMPDHQTIELYNPKRRKTDERQD